MTASSSSASNPLKYDLVLVGGSPSNLALAHRLVDLAVASGTPFKLAILEKAKEFGGHICSGAVVNPRILKTLFPDYEAKKLPIEGICDESHFSIMGEHSLWNAPNELLPAGLRKEGYWILSLSMVVAWMAEQLREKAKTVPHVAVDLFPGFSAHEVLYEDDRVVGVSVVEHLAASKNPQDDAVYADLVVFGDKGFLSGDLVKRFNLRPNPQIWSVGVKEVWSLPEEAPNYEGKVWHTLGYPLVDGSFGGGFIYGMKNRRVSVGLIASLDSPNPNLNPQELLQAYKKHPFLQNLLKDAKLVKYGAALLPEGGYYSLPTRFSVDGGLLVGDALGVLDVSNLNGVANSVETGALAAEVIHSLLVAGKPFTAEALKPYQNKVLTSEVGESLKSGRYFRAAWQENPGLLRDHLPNVLNGVDNGQPWPSIISAGLKATASGEALNFASKFFGIFDRGPIHYKKDHLHIDPEFVPATALLEPETFQKSTVYSREDAVFYAGPRYHHENRHIDEFNADTCVACIKLYDQLGKEVPCVSDCTAEVHRVDVEAGQRLHGMSLENCIQCRTCEMVCPEENLKVRPTEQGSGPDFMGL